MRKRGLSSLRSLPDRMRAFVLEGSCDRIGASAPLMGVEPEITTPKPEIHR